MDHYLINAHPQDNVLHIQVGDPDLDHSCWERPESMCGRRPLTQINASTPGSEVAAETAAAMAAASLVFKGSRDSTYTSTLLKHANQLFDFADKRRESYSVNIPKVATYYNSTGTASWLYHATGDATYLHYVANQNGQEFGNCGNPTWFSWNNKHAGTQVLPSRVSFFGGKGVSSSANFGLEEYRKTAEAVICRLLADSPTATSSRTDSRLIWWKYEPSEIHKLAMSEADFVLGNNPMKLSFLIGYGDNYPKFVHHRGASIPADATTKCKDGFKWLKSKDPNPNLVIGALVGGPFLNETYIDSRNSSM